MLQKVLVGVCQVYTLHCHMTGLCKVYIRYIPDIYIIPAIVHWATSTQRFCTNLHARTTWTHSSWFIDTRIVQELSVIIHLFFFFVSVVLNCIFFQLFRHVFSYCKELSYFSPIFFFDVCSFIIKSMVYVHFLSFYSVFSKEFLNSSMLNVIAGSDMFLPTLTYFLLTLTCFY